MSESAVPQFVLRKIKPAATYHQYGKTNVYTDGLNPAQSGRRIQHLANSASI